VLRALGVIFVLTAATSGCQPGSPLKKAGIELELPSSWQPTEPARWMAPGRALAAWKGPEGSSLVIYRTLPVPGGGSAETIVESLANRLTNLPELKVLARRTEALAGTTAARVEVLAPGFGDALAPSGIGKPIALEGKTLVPTHEVTIGIPRAAGPVYLTWHAPESAFGRIAPEIEVALRGLTLSPDTRQSTDSYSN
jgi:hypothetical protein